MAQQRPNYLIRLRTICILLLAIVAYCSKPDTNSFERWFGRQLTGRTTSDVSQSKLVARLTIVAADYETTNFGFGTLVRTFQPQQESFIGVFGHWYRIPVGGDFGG